VEQFDRKKVLYINNSMAMGGIETMILDFVRTTQAGGFQPCVCVFEAGGILEGQLQNMGCRIYHLPKRNGFDPLIGLRLRRLCRNEGIGVLHSHNFASWIYAGLAVKFGAKVRHVHTEHSGVDPSPRRFFLERRLAAQTDEVVAVSKEVKRYMVDRVGVPANQICVVYNGVDARRYSFDNSARSLIRSELSISENEVVAGVVARLAPVKGHSFLLEAMRIIRTKNPLVRLLVVGDGELRTELEGKATALGLSELIMFLGERHDIPRIMSAMDIYVLPSENEGMNLTLLEAMSMGLPVVARNVGGNPEIVRHDESGLLVSKQNVEQMAQGLLRLAADRAERVRMGDAARKRVVSCFSQTVTMQTYLALYSGGNGRESHRGKDR